MGIEVTDQPAAVPAKPAADSLFPFLVGHRTQIITGGLTLINLLYTLARIAAPIAGFTIPHEVGDAVGALNNVGVPAAGATLVAKLVRK